MLSKSLIQFSVDGLGCVPSCCLTWVQTTVEVMKIMVNSFKRSHACTAPPRAPNPATGHHWPTPPPETPEHSRASLGQSLVGSLLLSRGSWCTEGFVCALQESVSPVLCKFCNPIPLASKVKFSWGFSVPLPDPQVGKSVVGPRTSLTVREFIWYNCSSVWVSLSGLWVLVHTRFCLSPPSVSGRYGVWF